MPAGLLPRVFEGPEVTGRLTAEAAAATGLPAGTPVVAGGGDNACAAIGTGLIEEGHGVCSIGTSGTLFVHGVAPRIDPEGALNAFCASVPGGYHLMGVILSAGGALTWYRDKVARVSTPATATRSRRCWRRPLPCRPAPTGSCSCPTSPASARRTWTRMRAPPGSG